VQSSNPARYRNIGATLLGEIVADHAASGISEGPSSTVNTRPPGGPTAKSAHATEWTWNVVTTRLDRFYIPTNDAHDDLLPSFHVRWDILWSKEERDHATIIPDLGALGVRSVTVLPRPASPKKVRRLASRTRRVNPAINATRFARTSPRVRMYRISCGSSATRRTNRAVKSGRNGSEPNAP
jgi:hypothetical protein